MKNKISRLSRWNAKTLLKGISCEHPQLIALFLSLLNEKLSAKILELMDEKLRSNVVLRLFCSVEINSNANEYVEYFLDYLLENKKKFETENLFSFHKASKICAQMDLGLQNEVLNNLNEYDPDLASIFKTNCVKEEKESITQVTKEACVIDKNKKKKNL